MRRELLLPKLGLTMTEGVLLEWTVQPGESFQKDQVLFVVESEKAANEIGAEADGVLLEVVAQVGETLPCGAVIGYWDDGLPGDSSTTSIPDPAEATAAPASTTTDGTASVTLAPARNAASDSKPRIPVTPLARRLAAQEGIDLDTVTGSGPRGRISARDIRAAKQVRQDSATASRSAVAPRREGSYPELAGELRPPTNVERSTAERLTAAKQQVPHFYLSVDVEMSQVLALRAQLNEAQSDRKITINHFVLAAVGQALRAMPQINRIWTDEGILTLSGSDVGMAVDTEKGLLVPILRDAGSQSLGELADSAGELITRARAGRLSGGEMRGGAITVSNAGMHDVSYMASIINPGQSMILGVGSIRELFRPDADGQPVIHREMGMVLSADHRVLDGVTGLKFLKLIAQNLARPVALLLGGR